MNEILEIIEENRIFNDSVWSKICPVLITDSKFSLEKRLELIETLLKLLVNTDGDFKEFYGCEIIDVFHKIIDQIQKMLCEGSIINLNVDQIKKYVNNWCNSIQILTNTIDDAITNNEFLIIKLTKFPIFVIENLQQTFNFHQKSPVTLQSYHNDLELELKTLFKNSQQLLLKLLEGGQQSKLILSEILKMVPRLDLETKFECWKRFSKTLTYDNIDLINDSLEVIIADIEYYFEEILTINSAKEAQLQLKITNILLKISLDIFDNFPDDVINDKNINKVFAMLLNFKKNSKPYLIYKKVDETLLTSIENYVLVGGRLFLNNLTKRPKFFEIYFKYKRLGWLFLTANIQKNLLNCDRSRLDNWFNNYDERYNLICVISNCFQQCHTEFLIDLDIEIVHKIGEKPTKISLYELLLIRSGTLVLNLTKENYTFLERHFYNVLLEGSFWPSLFVLDLWCIMIRCANTKLVHDLFFNILEIYHKLFLRFEATSRLFVSVFLRRLFQFLPEADRSKIIKAFLPISMVNIHFWELGVSLEHHHDLVYEFINKSIIDFFQQNTNNGCKTIAEVQFLVSVLGVAKNVKFSSMLQPLVTNIFDIWSWITLPITNNIHGLLIFSLCEVTCKFLRFLNEDQLLLILEINKKILDDDTTQNTYDQVIPTVTLLIRNYQKLGQKLNNNHLGVMWKIIVTLTRLTLNPILKEQCFELFNESIKFEPFKDEHLQKRLLKYCEKHTRQHSDRSVDYVNYFEEQLTGESFRNQKLFVDLVTRLSKDILSLKQVCETGDISLNDHQDCVNNLVTITNNLQLLTDNLIKK